MEYTKSMSWYVDEAAEPTLSLDRDSQAIIADYKSHGTMTMSRTVGLIAECYLPVDDMLSSIEKDIDTEIKDIGLPLPDYMWGDFSLEPITLERWEQLDTQRHQYSLPSKIVEKMDEEVGERTKSRWLINAIDVWNQHPYDTRQERIEAKRDYIRLVRGERQTPKSRIMQRVRESGGRLLPDVYDRVWGEGDKVESLAEVNNWREAGMESNIVLTEPLSKDMDVDWTHCKQTHKHYAAAIVAAIRGMSEEYPLDTAWVVDCIHSTLDESEHICDRTSERVVEYLSRVHPDWITIDLTGVKYQNILERYNTMSLQTAKIAYRLDKCAVDTSWIGFDGDNFIAVDDPDTEKLDKLDIAFNNVVISGSPHLGKPLSKFGRRYYKKYKQ